MQFGTCLDVSFGTSAVPVWCSAQPRLHFILNFSDSCPCSKSILARCIYTKHLHFMGRVYQGPNLRPPGDQMAMFFKVVLTVVYSKQMKKHSEMPTLRAGCSKAEPKIFTPPQTPYPGVRDSQNLISCRWSLPLPTNPVSCRLMHTISSYRGNRATHPQTHSSTQKNP